MKKTIIYTRVSTENQSIKGVSLENQEERCKSYCKLHDFTSIEIISDKGVSGKDTNRDGFQRMLYLVKNDLVENVVVYSLSRFTRSVKDSILTLELFNKHKINFHSLTESIDTSTSIGRFFITTLSSISQYERELTSERTKSVLQYKRLQGLRVGSVRFGYKLGKDGKTLVENKNEQETIKLIFDLRDKQNKSYNEIVKELTLLKRLNKSGESVWYKSRIIRLYQTYSVRDGVISFRD